MAKKMHDTPNLDELESGPWPSFVTGLKELAKDKDYVVDLLGQLEESYKTKKGYWKGGTVGVFGYGGGVIPRFTEIKRILPQQASEVAPERSSARLAQQVFVCGGRPRLRGGFLHNGMKARVEIGLRGPAEKLRGGVVRSGQDRFRVGNVHLLDGIAKDAGRLRHGLFGGMIDGRDEFIRELSLPE